MDFAESAWALVRDGRDGRAALILHDRDGWDGRDGRDGRDDRDGLCHTHSCPAMLRLLLPKSSIIDETGCAMMIFLP